MIKNKFCIMPMMGDGIRFQRAGYNVPKPLIEVNKIPMFLKRSRRKLFRTFPEQRISPFDCATQIGNRLRTHESKLLLCFFFGFAIV